MKMSVETRVCGGESGLSHSCLKSAKIIVAIFANHLLQKAIQYQFNYH